MASRGVQFSKCISEFDFWGPPLHLGEEKTRHFSAPSSVPAGWEQKEPPASGLLVVASSTALILAAGSKGTSGWTLLKALSSAKAAAGLGAKSGILKGGASQLASSKLYTVTSARVSALISGNSTPGSFLTSLASKLGLAKGVPVINGAVVKTGAFIESSTVSGLGAGKGVAISSGSAGSAVATSATATSAAAAKTGATVSATSAASAKMSATTGAVASAGATKKAAAVSAAAAASSPAVPAEEPIHASIALFGLLEMSKKVMKAFQGMQAAVRFWRIVRTLTYRLRHRLVRAREGDVELGATSSKASSGASARTNGRESEGSGAQAVVNQEWLNPVLLITGIGVTLFGLKSSLNAIEELKELVIDDESE